MKKYAVIVAGGSGTRMNSIVPKQFILLGNKPILYYSIAAFLDAYPDINIIMVLPDEHIDKGQEILDGFFDERVKMTPGGRTRFHSVQNGLKLIDQESIIFVHDGVRPMVSVKLINRCFEAAVVHGSAIPVVPVKDSIRVETDDGSAPLDRKIIRLVQTPQTFHSKILIPAYNIDYKEQFTDEATVVEAFGLTVNLVEGDANNIKITRAEDLDVAARLLGLG